MSRPIPLRPRFNRLVPLEVCSQTALLGKPPGETNKAIAKKTTAAFGGEPSFIRMFNNKDRSFHIDRKLFGTSRFDRSPVRPSIHRHVGHDPYTGHIHVGFTCAASQTTLMPGTIMIRISSLRTGLEDINAATKNIG